MRIFPLLLLFSIVLAKSSGRGSSASRGSVCPSDSNHSFRVLLVVPSLPPADPEVLHPPEVLPHPQNKSGGWFSFGSNREKSPSSSSSSSSSSWFSSKNKGSSPTSSSRISSSSSSSSKSSGGFWNWLSGRSKTGAQGTGSSTTKSQITSSGSSGSPTVRPTSNVFGSSPTFSPSNSRSRGDSAARNQLLATSGSFVSPTSWNFVGSSPTVSSNGRGHSSARSQVTNAPFVSPGPTSGPTSSWNAIRSSASRGGSEAKEQLTQQVIVSNAVVSGSNSPDSRLQKIRRKLSDVADSGLARKAASLLRSSSGPRRRYHSGYGGYYSGGSPVVHHYHHYYYGSDPYYRRGYPYYRRNYYYRNRHQTTPFPSYNQQNSTLLQSSPYNETFIGFENGTIPEYDYENPNNQTFEGENRFTNLTGSASTGEEIFVPYHDDFLAECPEKVDSFLQFGNISFIFEDHHMFLIEDGFLNQTSAISALFPGVHKVDASVYDATLELVLLFRERKVYGFIWNDSANEFELASGFPKNLTESISFVPTAAFTWHDGYPVLVSDKGDFAVYEANFNMQIHVNETMKYLENLPEPARGISDWDGETALVFTEQKVYQYDLRQKNIVGEAESLDRFLNCFFVEIPSGDESKN